MGTAAAHATPSVSSASGRRGTADRGSAPHRKCASLSLATAHHGRAVSGGRGHHDARASAGRASQGDARPAGRRGERGWRRGSIGVARSARAAPDGYSLSFGNRASHVGAGAVYPVAYDVLADFEPVSRVADTPLWVVARKDLPAKDLKELITWLKAHPDKASAATVGPGSGSHLCGIYLQNNTGTRFQFVPYRGGAPAIADLVGGQVDIMCDMSSNSLPQVRAGQIKALAVMAKLRWFGAPDVPTVDETGVPGVYISFWHALWVPKGTPRTMITTLNAAVVTALADPTVRQRFSDQGQGVPPRDQQTPEALAVYHKAEIEKWWRSSRRPTSSRSSAWPVRAWAADGSAGSPSPARGCRRRISAARAWRRRCARVRPSRVLRPLHRLQVRQARSCSLSSLGEGRPA